MTCSSVQLLQMSLQSATLSGEKLQGVSSNLILHVVICPLC